MISGSQIKRTNQRADDTDQKAVARAREKVEGGRQRRLLTWVCSSNSVVSMVPFRTLGQ